ncbi:MAG: TonB-dependent receptor [Prevotella sp.]|jgi:hypothetical protein|nr:TonB-dependent receptor [Prevotella sp.]
MQKKLHFLLALMLLFTTSIMAQVTTSSINGKVVVGNENVIGATVTAVHVPSGTTYNAVTNVDGRYTIQGMRVGGPYKVTISYIGYKDDTRTNISLALGEPTVINANLKEDAKTLGEIVVTGRAGRGGNGASSNFSQQMIENTPTVNRNVYDVAKLSPLVNTNKFGGISIAGTNNRYNSFQIDGMVSNDVFGLTSTGTNGGQTGANPISMDAIEQIQIAVSPFDVRQSGFTGGAINAITKSGTNKFTGTAFGYYTDENMYGRYSQAYNRTQKLTNESTQTYGATFGGPIIKDKLFFFSSVEYKKNTYPSTYYAGADGYFMEAKTAQQLVDIYKKATGIEETYNQRDIAKEGTSLLGRLDWNINNNNHFTFRYQGNFSYADQFSNGQKSFSFNNSSYRMKDNTNSFVAELTSHLGAKYYNELRAGLTMVRDHRAIPYAGPTLYFSGDGYSINMGTEFSSGVNSLDQDIWTLEDNFSIYSGNHTITLGTHNEVYNMKNGFYQAAFGEFSYNYNQLSSFLADQSIAPNSGYVMKYSDPALTGTTEWKTPFKAGMFGFYIQDKWDLSTAFQLTYGMRIDFPLYFNSITYNPTFNATDNWAANSGAVVGRRPASMVMASPRVGFRWNLNDQHTSLLRGGVGIFNGRAPFVWLENAWANTGMEMKGLNIRIPKTGPYTGPVFSADGSKTPDQIRTQYGTLGGVNPDIVTVDHKFRYPQTFRTNLAWEQQLPFGVKMTLEALYSRALNAVWFSNVALSNNGKIYAVPGVEASATTYYNSNQNDTYPLNGTTGKYYANSVINLSNINQGHSYSFSAKFEKSFDFGLDLMASYTFGHSYSVNDGTSSVATSNWKYYYCVDPNKPVLSYSMFDMPHRLMVQASYNSKLYGNNRWQTHVTLTYNGNSGQRYSLTMNDNPSASFNGEFAKGNTLLYIPTKTELAAMNFVDNVDSKTKKVIMTAEQSRQAFENWIEGDKYAKDHRGQYADRNSNLAPWENHFDLHFTQDFFYLKEKGSKVSLVFDILNVGNLLNKHWGEFYSSTYNTPIITVYNVDTKTKTPSFVYGASSVYVSDYDSRWHMQVGLRVTF